jgi:hypothetical protein
MVHEIHWLYRTARRTLSHLEKYNFSGDRKKTIGRDDAITSKERHFSPLATILENRRVTLFQQVDMVSGIPPVGITQNERFFKVMTLLFWGCEMLNGF